MLARVMLLAVDLILSGEELGLETPPRLIREVRHAYPELVDERKTDRGGTNKPALVLEWFALRALKSVGTNSPQYWVRPAKSKSNRFLQHDNEQSISQNDSGPEIPSMLCDFLTTTDFKIPHHNTFRKALREYFLRIDWNGLRSKGVLVQHDNANRVTINRFAMPSLRSF
jgi:hypothetical protein